MQINLSNLFFIRDFHSDLILREQNGEIWFTQFNHVINDKVLYYGGEIIRYKDLANFEKKQLMFQLQWDEVIEG